MFCCAVLPEARTQSRDDSELNRGIEYYEDGKYPEAIAHLERAVQVGPTSKTAHIYLAMANDEMCSSSNGCDVRLSDRAISAYKKFLEWDPSDKDVTKNLAHVFYRLLRGNESEWYYRRALELDPNDPEALHNLAVILWERAYKVVMAEKAVLHLGRKSLFGHPRCEQLRAEAFANVQEGIDLLTRGSRIVNHVDIYARLESLYLLRGDLQCANRRAYKRDLNSADRFGNMRCVTWKASHNAPALESDPRGWR